MKYASVILWDESVECYVAWQPHLPGAMSDGVTIEEARANLEEAADLIVAHYREHGVTIPPNLANLPARIDFGEWI